MRNSNFPDQTAVPWKTRRTQPYLAALLRPHAASRDLLAVASVLLLLASLPRASAQITNQVFFDDFSAGVIDTNKYQPDAPFFEGGLGDIHATEANGVVEFTGTVSQQWWAGATLRLVQTFTASDETNEVVSVDRVSEAGVGTSSRSALWIMDLPQRHFVLFAD